MVPADLAEAEAVKALVAGCQAIVDFGGVSTEQPSAPILQARAVVVLGVVVLGVVVSGSQGAQILALKARYLSFKPPDPINP